MLSYQGKCAIKPLRMLAHKRKECSVNKVGTEGEGVVARHGRTGRKDFVVDVGWQIASLFTVHRFWPPKEYCQKGAAFCLE